MAIDEHNGVGLIQLYPKEQAVSAWGTLIAAMRYSRSLGVQAAINMDTPFPRTLDA